jgi:hypothetical protein
VGDVAAGVTIAPGQGQLKVASFRQNNHTCDFQTRSFTNRQNKISELTCTTSVHSRLSCHLPPRASFVPLRCLLPRPVLCLIVTNIGNARAMFSQCHSVITRHTSSQPSHHTCPNQKHIKDVLKPGSVHVIFRASTGVWSSMA